MIRDLFTLIVQDRFEKGAHLPPADRVIVVIPSSSEE